MLATLRQRDFGLLWLAGLISGIGDLALVFALPVHIYRTTGSTLATAGAFAASYGPRVLLGTVAGVYVDRWDRRRTMVVADLLRAVLLVALIGGSVHLPLIYVVAAIQSTVGLFFGPAESSLLPNLVGPERLVPANALNALNFNLAMLLGPPVGTALYATIGLRGVALFDGATFLASALLVAALHYRDDPSTRERNRDGSPWTNFRRDLSAGFSTIRHERVLAVVLGTYALGGVADGVFITLGLAPLVLHVLGGSEAQVGWFGTAQAIGGLIAGALVARAGLRWSMKRLYVAGMIGLGFTDSGAFNAARIASLGTPAVGLAMGSMFLSGFPVVAAITGRQSMVQTHADDAVRGRVFGALGTADSVALLIGVGIGGLLGERLGIVALLTGSAMLRVVAGVIAALMMPTTAGVAAAAGAPASPQLA